MVMKNGARNSKKRQPDAVEQAVLRSPVMKSLDRTLRLVAPKDVLVTLIGESGTGKEVLARRVHELSARSKAPFVPVNCAAIPEALFESELFGHERGAFTGATERALGKVDAAGGGTLFLDEIGELPLGMQAKLLRFLENRRFMRVGGTTKLQADVRLIFATLRPLEEEVRHGRFRADLFYRIQGITLRVPPLRERKADLLPLIAQFTRQLSAQHEAAPPRFSRPARAALLRHDWPGNVRELRNIVEQACLLRAGKQVRLADLPPPLQPLAAEPEPPRGATLVVSLDDPLDTTVTEIVSASLELEGGSRARAARRLGVSVRTIQRYLAQGRAREATGRASPGA